MELNRAQELVANFSTKKIIVVGDVVLDRYVFGKVERLNPEAPVPILHAHQEKLMTGGAGNTAKNVAGLGAQAVLISVVGQDHHADDVMRAAAAENYAVSIVRDTAQPTIEKIRYLVGGQQLLRVDYEETADSSPTVESQIIQNFVSVLAEADGIIVSDYAKGVITQKVAETVMSAMRDKNIPVMVDVKPSRIAYFTNATYMSPNRKEAHDFLGLNQYDHGGRSKEELSTMLQETFGTTVFLTLSDQGMYVQSSPTEGVHVPQQFTNPDEIVDPSGCGDTAAATILLAKLCGATDVEAAQLGNAAGAVVAKKIGAVAVTPKEILDMIKKHA